MSVELADRPADIGQQRSVGTRILAVDDEPIALAFLQQQLATLGYDTVTADNGRDALRILEKSGDAIDVILLDRIMPGIDGIAAAEEIRKDPSLRHIPIIMQTGADSSKDVQEGIDAGVFYYLTKPIDASLLRSVLAPP